MPKNRIIPVVLLKNGRVVQSKNFQRHQVLGTPSVIVGRLSNWYADELIYIDISRNKDYDLNRDDLNFNNLDNLSGIINQISKNCFMPLTVGGGIKNIKDIENRLEAGADKVCINTEAIENPEFLNSAAKIFGSQCIVVSIDCRKIENNFRVFTKFGKNDTNKSVMEVVKTVQSQGAGEIIINSIDNDGAGNGYDNTLIETVYNLVDIPLIALGGVGKWEHFEDCIKNFKNISVSASNIFQYTENSVYNAHKYLNSKKMNVRPPYIETIIKSGEE